MTFESESIMAIDFERLFTRYKDSESASFGGDPLFSECRILPVRNWGIHPKLLTRATNGLKQVSKAP
jgi:hypothetical protein